MTGYLRHPLTGILAEMSLATCNDELAARFLALGGRPDITDRIMAELDLTRRQVLDVLDQSELLEHKQVLGAAIAMRGPYVDTLSALQLRALQEVRARPADGSDEEREAWRHLLLLTVNGAAAGLQNTG